jgi:hypothetical protein
MNYDDYQELLARYLDGAIASREFQEVFLAKFKHEARELPVAVFDVLDALFGDVDAFCPEASLLAELNRANPNYYLDERMLRQRVSEVRKSLKEMMTTTDVRAP